MADHPRESIESTPPAPAPAPAPATAPATAPAQAPAAQHSGHPGIRLPPIHTMDAPMPPMPAVSAPPPGPVTTNNFHDRHLTPPSQRPQLQLPSIESLLRDHGHPPPQYQQWPHQQPMPWQPIPPSRLTPSYQIPPRRLSSSSALSASPTAPVYATADSVSQLHQPVALPGPASLLSGSHNNPYIPLSTASPPYHIHIRSVSTVPSTRRERKEAYRKGSPIPQPRKRNRPSVACLACRRRKIRCDQKKPVCSSCIKSKFSHGPCVYGKNKPPKTGPLRSRKIPLSSPEPSPEPQPENHMPDAFQNAEQRTFQPGPRHVLNGSLPSYAGSQSVSPGTYGGGSPSPPPQIEAGDKRWHADQLFPLVTSASYKALSRMPTDDNNAWSDLRTCIHLSRKIEMLQSPCITPLSDSDIGVTLPIYQEAQRLADAYLRTFETVYRILLLPAFQERFEEYFGGGQPDRAFLVQLQLCMAIGAVFVEDSCYWRECQERWIQEGEYWLRSSPPEDLAGLQTMCLLHLAKDVCGFGGAGGKLTYVSAGALLSEARCLGLHRDPDASVPNYEAELRRRLWATILEMVVQSSLDTGLVPGISLKDSRTSLPGNYDDDQLPLPTLGLRPPGTFTHTTVLLELHRSFPVRLAVAQYLAEPLSSSNTEASAVEAGPTMEDLIDGLKRASRALTDALRSNYNPNGLLPKRIPDFQRKMAEMLVQRFFLALNLNPRKSPTIDMPETRRSCSEAANRIWRDAVAAHNQEMDDFASLLSRGSGATYHATAMVATLTVVVDIREKMEQQKPLAEVTRPEFLDWVKSAVEWTFDRIQVASVDTGPYVQLHLLCSAALEEMKALQRVVRRKWATQSQQQNGTFVSQAEMKAGRDEAGRLVEDRLMNDLKLVADLLARLLRRFVGEPNGNGNVTGREKVGRQSNGNAAAAWERTNSVDERNFRAELERMAERGEDQIIPFNSVFDLRNYSFLEVPEVSVDEDFDPRGPRRRSLQ